MFSPLFKTCLATIVVLSLVGFTQVPDHVFAADVRWSSVSLPADGVSGRWVLAAGADTRFLTVAIDGTLYCYATPTATTDRLFKSTDGGLSWASVGGVKDTIIAIAAAPFDAGTVYYATTSCIYRSRDAGASFMALPPNPGGAGTNNIKISSLDVVRPGTGNIVAVATQDADVGQYGGVYVFDESTFTGIWEDTSIGSYDVLHVAFSPSYASDRTLLAVAAGGSDAVVRTKIGNGNWSQTIADARLPGVVPVAATIAFPSDYQPQGSFYVSLDTGVNQSDVCRVVPQSVPGFSSMTRLAIGAGEGSTGIDITSVVCTGEAGSTNIIAGGARQARTYVSSDAGMHWMPSQKSPGGQTEVHLAAVGASSPQMVYAVTCGTESGFSISADNGTTWNQTALIDTRISRLVDFAATPEPNQAATLFLITHNTDSAKRSVWRSQDNGAHWQRVFSAGLPGVDDLSAVGGSADGALFLAGMANGSPAMWLSLDRGQTFNLRLAPCRVVGWAFFNRNTFFVDGYDGVTGLVYRTDNGGLLYTEPTKVGSVSIASIALSPGYGQDRTLAVGNMTGEVFVSTDGGATFTQLGQKLPVSAGVGAVSVALDCDFSRNGNIYAAVDTGTTTTSKERVFRFSIGRSTTWQSIAADIPQDAIMKQICLTESCILYAVNSQAVLAAGGKGGITRCINPALAVPS